MGRWRSGLCAHHWLPLVARPGKGIVRLLRMERWQDTAQDTLIYWLSHPPLQVMAKEKVSSKFMALKRDGTSPVNFFGDNEFGWCSSEDMLSFDEHYTELSEQKTSRQYRVSRPKWHYNVDLKEAQW